MHVSGSSHTSLTLHSPVQFAQQQSDHDTAYGRVQGPDVTCISVSVCSSVTVHKNVCVVIVRLLGFTLRIYDIIHGRDLTYNQLSCYPTVQVGTEVDSQPGLEVCLVRMYLILHAAEEL